MESFVIGGTAPATAAVPESGPIIGIAPDIGVVYSDIILSGMIRKNEESHGVGGT